MFHLQNEVIDGQEFVLKNDVVNYLGPKLTLKNCQLTLRTTARGLVLNTTKLEKCQIDAKKKLLNFRSWCNAKISDCSFRGTFLGNEFGHWPLLSKDGAIANCNFEGAILNDCRFWNCDISKMRFAKWPCFVVLEPFKHRKALNAVDWPENQGMHFEMISDPDRNEGGVSAFVGYAPEFLKDNGGTEKELLEQLSKFDFVLL
ncbi:pentapeptide repeat-containing protein [Blastopirellula marina]|uniref:Pentapeptide repeat-containing protein n=1 Tax=Blastopirellula marina TaxID=124 RepID=A0A2S8GSC3_9BACT|nr:pentapeptide repeat-containing protein [Blastopirellula marina]PQO47335.1 hypothetical protein C5Y93_04655 [Blastopirellula marina]